MSVEHKAMIIKGYELAEDWELVVDADYVMAHEDYFIEADAYQGEKVIFGFPFISFKTSASFHVISYLSLSNSDTALNIASLAANLPA